MSARSEGDSTASDSFLVALATDTLTSRPDSIRAMAGPKASGIRLSTHSNPGCGALKPSAILADITGIPLNFLYLWRILNTIIGIWQMSSRNLISTSTFLKTWKN
jgi:hypothetical protein